MADSSGVVFTVSEMCLDLYKPDVMAIMLEHAAGDAGNLRLQNLLKELNIGPELIVAGVIGVMDHTGKKLTAMCKVVVKGKGGFIHEEPYIFFPSDEFKTKLLLVAGPQQ